MTSKFKYLDTYQSKKLFTFYLKAWNGVERILDKLIIILQRAVLSFDDVWPIEAIWLENSMDCQGWKQIIFALK